MNIKIKFLDINIIKNCEHQNEASNPGVGLPGPIVWPCDFARARRYPVNPLLRYHNGYGVWSSILMLVTGLASPWGFVNFAWWDFLGPKTASFRSTCALSHRRWEEIKKLMANNNGNGYCHPICHTMVHGDYMANKAVNLTNQPNTPSPPWKPQQCRPKSLIVPILRKYRVLTAAMTQALWQQFHPLKPGLSTHGGTLSRRDVYPSRRNRCYADDLKMRCR